jgi:hypothetical protein
MTGRRLKGWDVYCVLMYPATLRESIGTEEQLAAEV